MEPNFTTCYGKCRCCMAMGTHRILTDEYYHNGIRELYLDMFLECFNITLSTKDNVTNLICLECVLRLRDASVFRMQVLSSDQQLHEELESHAHFVIDVMVESGSEVKTEPGEVKLEYADEIEDLEPDEKHLEPPWLNRAKLVEGEAEMLSRFSPGTLRRLPRRKDLRNYCLTYLSRLDDLRGVTMRAKSIEATINNSKSLTKHNKNSTIKKDKLLISEKIALIHNACTILETSNMTPFKTKTRFGYPCFYCKAVLETLEKLKDHQYTSHTKTQIKSVLRKYTGEELIVYADVTNLKCTECDEKMTSFNEFKSHLIKAHKKTFYTEFTERIVPIVEEDRMYVCQMCRFKFETFDLIRNHMNNTHYRNYICEECDTGYVTKHRLKAHIIAVHMTGSFTCKLCGKLFNTMRKYQSHIKMTHKREKRSKCNLCSELFSGTRDRRIHMVEFHGETPLVYKCNVCDKNFKKRDSLFCHVKRSHLEQKDFECELCPYKCFSRGELRMHMIKHSSEKLFDCPVCKKSYARKKTLMEHMKIHNNDRRYVCKVCSQAFVQNCSLKGHMKTHHSDYYS